MERYEVVVIGAGLSGVCAAIKLRESGINSFRIFEKAGDVGGTWRENHYPGVACDVPSHLYSYSFAPNPDWSRMYAPGSEIWNYVRKCAIDFGVHDRITFDTTIKSATWMHDHWVLETADGQIVTSRSIISALGGLHTPNIPELPGKGDFRGAMFHTTDWPDEINLVGKRVAVVGTGATAVQIVPEIADDVAELIVFQRNPVWVGAKKDPEYTADERAEFRRNPEALKKVRKELYDSWESTSVDLHRAGTRLNNAAEERAREQIERGVSDPVLAKALTPDHNFTCKRPTISNRYYATFEKPNVRLITGAVETLTRTGVVSSGQVHDVDIVIFATGFKAFDITTEIEVTGVNGLTLAEVWRDEVTSYRSVMVHDFPNFFLMMGPNGTGLHSALQTVESQAHFAVSALELLGQGGVRALNPRQEFVDAFTHQVRDLFETTTHGKGCTSWWSDQTGFNHSIWPGTSDAYRSLHSEIDLTEFDVTLR